MQSRIKTPKISNLVRHVLITATYAFLSFFIWLVFKGKFMISYMYVSQVREKQMAMICLYIIHVRVALLLSLCI